MSKDRFLPPKSRDFAIPQVQPNGFTSGDANLLDDIGRKMRVSKTTSNGRIPSPFSAAFIYYLNLFGKGLKGGSEAENENLVLDRGRNLLQLGARDALRGISAAFALRKVMGLKINVRAHRLILERNDVESVLLEAVAATPRGGQFWNPVIYFTISERGSQNLKEEVFAGISPLTGFYPSATPPKRLNSLFWYDSKNGVWYDPTSERLDAEGAMHVSNRTRLQLSELLKEWVSEAVRFLHQPNAFSEIGVLPGDRTLLLNEYELWQRDLNVIKASKSSNEEERLSVVNEWGGSPFFNKVCVHDNDHFISDLPLKNGILIVTREELLDKSVRIYGRTFGSPHWGEIINSLPSSGSNLGLDLKLGDLAIPIPYVFVDQLFTSKLAFISEHGLSAEWYALKTPEGTFFLPFKAEMLNLLTPSEMVEKTKIELDHKQEKYMVSVDFGGSIARRNYAVNGQGEYVYDIATIPQDVFDIRLFPNFDLKTVSAEFDNSDSNYYARVRFAPGWSFEINAFHWDENSKKVSLDLENLASGEKWANRSFVGLRDEAQETGYSRSGQSLLFTFSTAPSGFYIQDYGICLLKLPPAAESKQKWDIGVDFGTSNTCVTFKQSGSEDAKVLRFPVLTTTLLAKPTYSFDFEHPLGGVTNEGAGALLDFFYKQFPGDSELSDQDYFPTQFVTKHSDVQANPKWLFDNGLIFFRNVSLTDPQIVRIMKGFAEIGNSERNSEGPKPKFNLKQDIKWTETLWLQAFMQHLRTQILMTASRQNASIGRIRYSYPKAFGLDQQRRFMTALRKVWEPEKKALNFDTMSESEALRSFVVKQENEFIVFDVGGGTTDIISFSHKKPVFQASFKLAARQINEYVITSHPFRIAFLASCREVFGDSFGQKVPNDMAKKFQAMFGDNDYNSQVIETIWLGLLETIEREDVHGHLLQDILNSLRRESEHLKVAGAKEAVYGYFLSIATLFGGLSYYAGALLAMSSAGKIQSKVNFSPKFVDVVLTGNGSKLYRMIDDPDAEFSPIVRRIIALGMNSTGCLQGQPFSENKVRFEGMFKHDGRVAPKVSVALGLLSQDEDGKANQEAIPVANVVSETGFRIGDDSFEFGDDLNTFYNKIFKDPTKLRVAEDTPQHLSSIIDELNRSLNRGYNGRVAILPKIGDDWGARIKEKCYDESTKDILDKLKVNAKVVQQEMANKSEQDTVALEPPLIIELSAMLHQFKKQFSGAPPSAF